MVKNDFLDALCDFTREAVKGFILPCSVQREGEEQIYRAPEVFRWRLDEPAEFKKKVPYIIHQIVVQRNGLKRGEPFTTFQVRSVFCVYSQKDSEGANLVGELTDRVSVAMLKQQVLAHRYRLDLDEDVETLIYPDNTAPYFAAEMATTWKAPPIHRWEEQIR